MFKSPRLLAALVAAVLPVLTVADCGSDDPSTSESATGPEAAEATTTDANEADLAFARDMVPHHQQALEMARMAPDHTDDPELLELAAEIEAAQDPEIAQMTGWLESWGQNAPPTSMDHGAMGHGTTEEMPGMMTAEEMAELETLQDVAWERMFLTMMIRHHEGAIEMARAQLDAGQNPEVTALAGQVVADQEAEIATMTTMLEVRTD